MHVELPKSKTLKEFGGEYVMIVISILTALGLEQVMETVHHRHLAHEASENIEAELRTNIKEISNVLKHNEHDLKQIETVRDALREAILVKTDDKALMARFKTDWNGALILGIHVPALRHEAWDAAVANQAVTWIGAEKLQRYATAYANIRDVHAMTVSQSMFLDGPRYMDAISNYQLGLSTPADMYRTLTQVQSAYGSIDGNLQSLLKEIDLTDKPDAAAH